MYVIINNQVRRTDRLSAEELASATLHYDNADLAEEALLRIKAANGDSKACRELKERAEFSAWLKKRDELVDGIIRECDRLDVEVPLGARVLGSSDLEELKRCLEELKSR